MTIITSLEGKGLGMFSSVRELDGRDEWFGTAVCDLKGRITVRDTKYTVSCSGTDTTLLGPDSTTVLATAKQQGRLGLGQYHHVINFSKSGNQYEISKDGMTKNAYTFLKASNGKKVHMKFKSYVEFWIGRDG